MTMIYRNRKLLDLAREVPFCFGCGRYNDGSVVAAHSNQQKDGKGMGIKAHDYRIAFLGPCCHAEIDQGSKLSKEQRIELWERAHRKSIGWLFESGHLAII